MLVHLEDDEIQSLPQHVWAAVGKKDGSSMILEPETVSFASLPLKLLHDLLEHIADFLGNLNELVGISWHEESRMANKSPFLSLLVKCLNLVGVESNWRE